MSKDIEDIRQKIIDRHAGDEKQLEVIFSPASRLLVEAPAGYGKTKTMISRIAYMLVTNQIPHPKKLLALTFSVNIAHKIKKDVEQQIPVLLQNTDFTIKVNEKISVANYHKFCKDVLRMQGYSLHESLLLVDDFETVDEKSLQHQEALHLNFQDTNLLLKFGNAVNTKDKDFVSANLNRYCEIIIRDLLPAKLITYNALLTLTIKLFRDFPKIRNFYTKYFVAIIVDEYQDTNWLSYWLLFLLVGKKTKVILLGDSLQRIYGFIGAVPDVLEISKEKFGLIKISLDKNHRFSSNPEMLNLDANIRKNAENPAAPYIEKTARVIFDFHATQSDEAQAVMERSLLLIKDNPGSKVAILVKQKKDNHNLEKILNVFDKNKTPYFYGLFTDQEHPYIKFNKNCLLEFEKIIGAKEHITKKLAVEHVKQIEKIYDKSDSLVNALIELLNIFWLRLFTDNAFFSNDEKKFFVRETFEHNGLKQYIEFVEADIVFSTVHAAKGLEWDFVIIPDMEQDSFPNKWGLCKNCLYKKTCVLSVTSKNENDFLEELSVFYVAVTRAKKQIYFSASSTQILDKINNTTSINLSCLINLPGILIPRME